LPQTLRASGLALVQTGQAVTRLVSSIGFGFAWTFLGSEAAVWTGLAALVLGIVAAVGLLRDREVSRDEQPA
ncbi:MAG: MFS transporter, partial [Stackebrandtia sp.]